MESGDGNGDMVWSQLGKPKGGTVNAIALTQNQPMQVFLGTEIGVYLLELTPDSKNTASKRLPSAPIGVLALAVSPNFIEDQTIAAGTNTGIYISRDGGGSWIPGKHALPDLAVLSVCFSPSYRADGLIIAGTLQDGILVSGDRGYTWHNRNFGLLDSLVYCVVASPQFETDGILFAGTETAIYYSYNRARAWKMLDFPVDAAPILSVAPSPFFLSDGVIFAGTEANGLFRSSDRGETWQPVSFPAACVNVLSYTPDNAALMAGTDQGLYRRIDEGESWAHDLSLPNVMAIGCGNGFRIAAAVDEGVLLSPIDGDWSPVNNLSLRAIEGIVLSPEFPPGTAYLYGASEGIWKSVDGGDTWDQIISGMSGANIFDMAVSQHDAQGHILAFASDAGVFTSANGGLRWKQLDKSPAALVRNSPDGRVLLVCGMENSLRVTRDGGATWQDMPGPWDGGGKILNVGVGGEKTFYIAYLDRNGDVIHILQYSPGNLKEIVKNQVNENLVVSFWIPTHPSHESEWYFSMGDSVYRHRGNSKKGLEETRVVTADGPVNLLALKGIVSDNGVELVGLSNRSLFHLKPGEGWKTVCNFDKGRAVALSSIYQQDGSRKFYVLFLGGDLHQVTFAGHKNQ